MVASSPLWRGHWTAKKFRATVINDIWPELVFFSLVAAMVCLVSEKTSHSLAISNQMLTVLGTVLGLVISFRTSTAYERYQDGRKMWTNIMLSSRNLAQLIWIHVPSERVNKDSQKEQSLLESIIEKKSMVNLIQAFSVSVKHFLRGEPGIYYEDLYPLICFLPRYATHPPTPPTAADMLPLWRASDYGDDDDDSISPASREPTLVAPTRGKPDRSMSLPNPSHVNELGEDRPRMSWYNSFTRSRGGHKAKRFDPERALPTVTCDKPLKPARSPPATTFYDYFPVFRIFKPIHKLLRPHKKRDEGRTLLGRRKHPELIESNVPLEITLYLSSYFAWLLKCGLIQPAIATGISNGLTSFQDTIANLERIRNTPLPFAYQVHLRMTVWIYVFFLPFQIYSAFGYLTIPATAFAAFLLLGFLEIGQEIENPFNYDLNDLDLDHFCLSIQREMHEITAHNSIEPSSYIFTPWNQPFAPADRRHAEQIAREKDHEYWGREYGDRSLPNEEKERINGEGAHINGMTSIRRMLLRNWKEVDEVTRDYSAPFQLAA